MYASSLLRASGFNLQGRWRAWQCIAINVAFTLSITFALTFAITYILTSTSNATLTAILAYTLTATLACTLTATRARTLTATLACTLHPHLEKRKRYATAAMKLSLLASDGKPPASVMSGPIGLPACVKTLKCL